MKIKFEFSTLFIVLCLFGSCTNKESELKHQLKNFLGNEIFFTKNLLLFNCQENIDSKKLIEAKQKFVIFVDKTNCTDCKLKKMFSWIPYFEDINKLGAQVVVIFETDDISNLTRAFKMYKFKFPYFVDLNGEFKKKNKLPDIENLKTFLVNNDSVILAGQPYNNNKLWSLYKEQIGRLEN